MSKIREPFLREATAAELQGAHIIGRGRGWQWMRFSPLQLVPPDTKTAGGTVGKFYPNGMYLTKLVGLRSDGVECMVTLNVDARWFSKPEKFWQHMSSMFEQLQTYRDCECVGPSKGLPGKVCAFHGQSLKTLHETLTAPGPSAESTREEPVPPPTADPQ